MESDITYYIYINAFWGGFSDKTDANHIGFFETLFSKTKLKNFTITDDLSKANVLFESLFNNSLVNYKKWLYKIHYSGEPHVNNYENYDIVLYSEKQSIEHKNIVDIPLFAYYIHNNIVLDKLLSRPVYETIPKEFCCFIVSNGGCYVRNKMFEMLNKYKKVHSYGRFQNNMNEYIYHNYWEAEFIKFIARYKFIICFENTKFGTYSTEKIINPYLANTIPIYWSSHNIKNVFNMESMLFLEDESEESYKKLIDNIIELDNNDVKYLEVLNKPIFTNDNIEYWNNNYTIDKIAEKIDNII